MPDRSREVVQGMVPGARVPVLGAALLARIREMNRDYVELLLVRRSLPDPDPHSQCLPVKVIDALRRMPAASRHALAAAPFALYSLQFDDRQFWTTALADTEPGREIESIEARYGAPDGIPGAAPMHAALCELALFLAWHTAASNRVAARVLFALPDTLAVKLVAAPLWHLRRIAMDYPGLLTPRWPANPAFWPDLIRFAAAGDARRLETAQLLGNQLIAIELEGLSPRTGKRSVRMRPVPKSP